MASKPTPPNYFFFIFDFYLMKDSKDDNDILPDAIIYFYPTDDQIKKQKLLECGEIIGVVQFFQNDLLKSISKTLHFQKTIVVHEHYGRNSSFLSLPHDRYTEEEAQILLTHILNLFNMLYGTWNHVYSIYGKDNKLNEFLNQALTPIINYIFNQNRSISNLFSIVEYTPLKSGNQRVLLESKHFLHYLKSKYGLKDGLIGYDNKVLYSTWNSDTTFYLQLLFQLRKELPDKFIDIPWESEFKLKNGVSLFRIHIRQSLTSTSIQNSTDRTKTTTVTTPSEMTTPTLTVQRKPTQPINIFDGFSSASDDASSLKSRFSADLSPSVTDKKRYGMLISTDLSCSSEETGFETDSMDELSSPVFTNAMSSPSESIDEKTKIVITEESNEDLNSSSFLTWHEESLTDEQKLEHLRSRSSTMSNDIEKTIKIDYEYSLNDEFEQIHITQIGTYENDDDDNVEEFPVIHRTLSDLSRNRTRTITSNPDLNIQDFHKNDRHEIRMSWTDIPDKNIEHERNELVLYVQRNSRMMFAGIFEQNLLNDDYLKKLWTLMLAQMANMETDIQVISTVNENIKVSSDVKFQLNENTHLIEFERIFDGTRCYRKIPSEESAYMALFARSELNRNSDRKIIGISRGSHLISVDRRLPDRVTYSCRRFQETL